MPAPERTGSPGLGALHPAVGLLFPAAGEGGARWRRIEGDSAEDLEAAPLAGGVPPLTGLDASAASEAALDRELAAWTGPAAGGCAFVVVRTAAQLDRARRRLASLAGAGTPGATLESWGVDPDYYYAAVPLFGPGRRRAQRFALGLKKRRGGLKDRVKSALIAVGRPEPLYEAFVAVLRARPPAWTAGATGPAAAALPLTSCLEPHGNDLVLMFGAGAGGGAGGGRGPDRVFKAARDPRYSEKIANEDRALTRVGAAPDLAPLVPRLLARGETAARRWLIQSGRRGRALSARLLALPDARRERSLLAPSIALLARLGALAEDARAPEPAPERSAWNSLARLDDELLDANPTHADRLRAARDRLRTSPRRFFLHGDYWQTNLLVDARGHVDGLIDWEWSHASSPVPADLVWFLANAAYYSALREDPSAGLATAFRRGLGSDACWALRAPGGGPGPLALDWCRRTGFDPGLLDDATAWSLLQLANRERLAYGRPGAMDGLAAEMLSAWLER